MTPASGLPQYTQQTPVSVSFDALQTLEPVTAYVQIICYEGGGSGMGGGAETRKFSTHELPKPSNVGMFDSCETRKVTLLRDRTTHNYYEVFARKVDVTLNQEEYQTQRELDRMRNLRAQLAARQTEDAELRELEAKYGSK